MSILSRERIVADASYNRWLVPPAALLIHLSIGMIYGFSVFWPAKGNGLLTLIGNQCDAITTSLYDRLFITSCDWFLSDVVWTFSIAIVCLGLSAAVFGHWLERAGPRKAGVAAAILWGGGLVLASAGVYNHQLWLIWLGAGVVGGIGLGLGYISPVSTLIKWFPDRRGLATGMAIMGFGGGAMIGTPIAAYLIDTFSTWQAFLYMGCFYFIAMMIGAFGYRVPPADFKVEGIKVEKKATSMIAKNHVHVSHAHKTYQFWLLWGVLCLNVSAGIGVLAVAKPMFQEIAAQNFSATEIGAIAGGFVALLSLSNIIGRIFWASSSDYLGRKLTYAIFFSLGTILYFSAPWAGNNQYIALFVLINLVILTMYGGGFATIPAYLADIFGTQHVGAIHGRLLTAWAAAGILGPRIMTYFRESLTNSGIPEAEAYSSSFRILALLLILGFILNFFVKPLASKHFMSESELKKEKDIAAKKDSDNALLVSKSKSNQVVQKLILPIAWILVGLPILWGISNALQKGIIIFH
jgi:MFS family permease|tara:strand:+ start:139 stop:1707 length:1569 start_codon:yes stop_codon:yes gene_type:complete